VQGKLAVIDRPELRSTAVLNRSSCYETSTIGNHPVRGFLCSSRSPS
jgi:hypothetical protein